ncbi:MAG: hypothetical protein H0W13_05150 [Nitrospirales bacterium]|nr:hypothetical protein [Nitrospirales bacterium]
MTTTVDRRGNGCKACGLSTCFHGVNTEGRPAVGEIGLQPLTGRHPI